MKAMNTRAIWGALVGDACGATLEFYDDEITEEIARRAMTMPGGGSLRVGCGQITDDGELTLALTVNSAGQLLASEVLKSSGNTQLDRQAQSIAARAGPFERFTPGMLRQAEQIVVVSRFTFARDDTLQTLMGAGNNTR